LSPGAGGELAVRMRAEREVVETALAGLAATIGGDERVSAPMRYALAAGGKRLRPILCAAAFRTAGGIVDREDDLYRAACALELIHTYSLMHDDLPCMDNDELRRGRPTSHRVFGTGPAVVAGFALVPLACRTLDESARLMGIEPRDRLLAVRELCRGAGAAGMVGGQVLDLEAEGRQVSLRALRQVHALKTGALFTAAMRVGAALAAADPDVLDALGEYGLRLGLAFQITDDVLDVTMDAAALGKTPGKDAGADKPTFAALLGVDQARDAARREADAAVALLRDARLHSPLLDGIARFAVERDR
jgi:geranylgeranyl pyrophosphate synthase